VAAGVLTQRDTYFQARVGRLKLREETDTVPRLIAYDRSDRTGTRESRYRIVEVAQPDGLKAVLSATLGVEAVVAKQRRLFLWRGVRIHLDEVEGIGSFIEFEAIATVDSDLGKERKTIETLRSGFEISDADLVKGSYCDLTTDRADAARSATRP